MNTQNILLSYDKICVPSEDIVAREIEGDIIIVPLISGIGDSDDEIFALNESGKKIWQLLDGKNSLGEVINLLTLQYDQENSELGDDVIGFVSELVNRKFLCIKE